MARIPLHDCLNLAFELVLQLKLKHNLKSNCAKFELEGPLWEVGYDHKGVLTVYMATLYFAEAADPYSAAFSCVRSALSACSCVTHDQLLKYFWSCLCRKESACKKEVGANQESPVHCQAGLPKAEFWSFPESRITARARGVS